MKRLIPLAICAFALAGCQTALAGQGSVRDMQSLAEWMKKPPDQQEPSYLLVRCAGLYHGMGAYIGFEKAANLKDSAVLFSLAAMKARQQRRGGNIDDYQGEVERDECGSPRTNNARMHQNYETGGQAFGCDPLSLGDFQLCNSIAKGKS
jgi:hypothetical protein